MYSRTQPPRGRTGVDPVSWTVGFCGFGFRVVKLEPAVVAAAREQGFDGVLGVERDVPSGLAAHGKTSSRWVVLRRGILPSLRVADARFRGGARAVGGPVADDHADARSAVRLTRR